MIIKTIIKTRVVVLVLFFVLIIIASCGPKAAEIPIPEPTTELETPPTATPEIGTAPAPSHTPTRTLIPSPTTEQHMPNSVIILSDGSQIILKPEARIEILQESGTPAGSGEIIVKILNGEIMVVPNPENGFWIYVQNSEGISARVKGCAMVIDVDYLSNLFGIQCIDGVCDVSLSPDALYNLTANFAWVIQDGSISAKPEVVDFTALYDGYTGDMPACAINAVTLPIPMVGGQALTPTLSSDLATTATAACADFQQQFPATPCPPNP